jgi:hypothetical protein
MYILIFYFSDLSHIKGKMKMDFNKELALLVFKN